jgi:hypothetical protein
MKTLSNGIVPDLSYSYKNQVEIDPLPVECITFRGFTVSRSTASIYLSSHQVRQLWED